MNNIKRAGVALVAGLASSTALVALAAPASASACTEYGVNAGAREVTLCLGYDTLTPGFPGAGSYVVVSGYVEYDDGTGSPIRQDFNGGQTGVAYNTIDNSVTFTAGTPIPNTCVGTICSPNSAPGVQVVLFSDTRSATVRIDGTEYPVELPTVCLSTSGLC